MRRRRWAVMVLSLTACGTEPSGPAPLSRDALTRHIDSLAVAAADSGDTARASLLTDIEIPLAFGDEPAHIGVVIDSIEPEGDSEPNPAVWPGLAYAAIDPAHADTLISFVAPIDEDAITTLRVRRHLAQVVAAYISGDSIDIAPPEDTTVHVTVSIGAAIPCTLHTPVRNPRVTALTAGACHVATIGVTGTLAVQHAMPGSVASFQFGGTLTGVVLLDPSARFDPSQSRPARRASASTTPFTNAALLADP